MIWKFLKDADRRKLIFQIIVLMVLVMGGTIGYFYITRDTNPIPTQIRKQLTFSPFTLSGDTKTYSATDYKVASTDNKEQILSYTIKLISSTVSISEQSQPPQFVEIPGYKDSFLSNVAKQYTTVQSSNGVIYLGRLARQSNKQLGIMLEKGLLVFMIPSKEMDTDHWRMLGDQFEIQKVDN